MWSLQFCVLYSLLVYSFNLQGPQLQHVAAAPVGQDNRITFHVYSAGFHNTTDEPSARNSELPQDIVPNYPLTLVIHGFTGSYLAKSVRMIRDGLLLKGLKNVVVVGWGTLARVENAPVNVSYYQIVEDNVPLVANEITSWLKSLHEKNLINYSEVHIIGFSLGAQIAGIVGSQLEGEIGRISALDPPKIAFAHKPLPDRIDSSDAQFVFVVHTSSGIISYVEPIGHVDFYPNGGLPPQPECPADDLIHSTACSHYMAYKVFTETIYNDHAFNATKCADWDSYLEDKCKDNEHAIMGYVTKNVTQGSFYIKTNMRPPFGSTLEGEIPLNVLALMAYTEEDRLRISSTFRDKEEDSSNKDKYETSNVSEDISQDVTST